MVQNVNPTFVKTPNCQVTQITTTVGANFAAVPIYTGGANGSKVVSCIISANTSSTQDVRITLTSSTNTGYINVISVSSLSGFNSALPPINPFAVQGMPMDSDGNPFVFLPSSNWSLNAQVTTQSSTWAATSFMAFTVTSGDF